SVDINGQFTWSGGSLAGLGVLNSNAGAVISGSSNIANKTATFSGFTGWSPGSVINAGSSGTIVNAAGATFTNVGDSTFQYVLGGATPVFTNLGTFAKTGGTGTTLIGGAVFNTSGALDIQIGTLSLTGGGALGGTIAIASGAMVRLGGGAFAATSGFSGGGALVFAGGSTTFSAPSVFGNSSSSVTVSGGTAVFDALTTVSGSLSFSAGTIAGSDTLDLDGLFTWSGGGLVGAGILNANAGAMISGSEDIANRTAVFNGATVWADGSVINGGSAGTLVNSATGTFVNSGDATYQYVLGGATPVFTNLGTFAKSSGRGTTVFSGVTFNNSGTISVSSGTLSFTGAFNNSGGSLIAAGGNFSFSNALNVGTGTIGGFGTFTAPSITAGGLVLPGNSPGLLNIAGDLTLLGTATTLFEIGGTSPGSTYDVINVSGTATLNGTLGLMFANGFESTVTGANTFTILNAASLAGAFSNAANGSRLATTDGFGSFQVNYSSAALTLSNFVPVPEPSTWALLSCGLLLVFPAFRRRRARENPETP
ncbi:MAG: Na-Ca exchanger/integrin-beta4, partial [Verrucomicrobia bacterium]|nr:Na-Ca exchanger/integrin-beta4 [Verrucomicrobiota bacterium]